MSKKSILTTLLLVCGLLLVSSSILANKGDLKPEFPGMDENSDCGELCVLELRVPGMGDFEAEFRGTLTAAGGAKYNDNGRVAVPIRVLGSSMRSYIDGLGETVMWLDKDRPLVGSYLRENTPGTLFPATQEMRTHIYFRTDAFPGQTFRSITPFTVRSESMKTWPPQDARFELAGPVEFENVNAPGEAALTLLRGTATVGTH